MNSPNNLSREVYSPRVDPDRAAAMGGMGIIAAQHAETTAELSNGMITASEVQQMDPGKQAELHDALKINAAGEAQQAQIDADYRAKGLR